MIIPKFHLIIPNETSYLVDNTCTAVKFIQGVASEIPS